MFNRLSVSSLESAHMHTDPTNTLSIEMVDNIIDSMADVLPPQAARMQLAQTRQEVIALIGAIETYGLSRALLAFANHDGSLRAAVTNIPALESLAADLSVEQSTEILASLKAIDLNDAEPAEEVLIAAFLAGYVVFSLISSIVATMIAFKGFRHWNTTKEDKEARLAKVVPFTVLETHLKVVHEVPAVLKALEVLTMPKTEEEHTEWCKKVASIAAPLVALGVHVTDDKIEVSPLPVAMKANIEDRGYKEGSLAELATLIEGCKDVVRVQKEITFKKADTETNAMTKEERKYGWPAHDHLMDVVSSTFIRVGKVIKLASGNAKAIKSFYKE